MEFTTIEDDIGRYSSDEITDMQRIGITVVRPESTTESPFRRISDINKELGTIDLLEPGARERVDALQHERRQLVLRHIPDIGY